MSDPVIVVTLPADLATVWNAFRDPAVIRRWHGWEYGEGALDDEIAEIYERGAVAEVVAHTLHIGGHLFAFEDAGPQTVVRVTRTTPLTGADGIDWDAWYDDIDEGWVSFLHQLRFALARQWGKERATLRFDGEATGDAERLPVELAAVADLPAGSRYEAVIAGDELTGELWFRTPLQLGLTVAGWGPGLLVFAAAPGQARPYQSAGLTLTTYDGANERRAERWGNWWARSYRPAPTAP